MTSARVARDPCRVLIFDTTLRDGEQAPGCTMSLAEKVAVAEQLLRLGVAIASGATTLNIPDTVGYATPDEYGELIRRVCALAAERPGVTVSTHCHDDLGLAVANSLAGVRAGARQVECTINGIGERAGNAALEEIVMALRTRAEYYETHTAVDTREILQTSRLVSKCTGVHVP